MDPPYRLQPVGAYTGRADGLSRPEQHSWFTVLGSQPEPYVQPPNTSSLPSHYTAARYPRPPYASSQSYHTARLNRPSQASSQSYPTERLNRPSQASSQSYHTARPNRPSQASSRTYYSAYSSQSHLTTNSASTWSSDMSFPYSVTSINSHKSRKNVLYPRRAHPLPVAVPSEHFSISPDALIWQVRFLCTTLLPHAETRLVPAGRVLLQSLGPLGDSSQPVPIRTDEETRCCSEIFIALAHEVLLKDAVGAGELEGPCKLLHANFKDILFKSGAFSSPGTSKTNEMGLKAPAAGALALHRFSSMLLTLFSILNTFEGALNTIRTKTTAAKDGALQDHYRMALLELSVSTGLTLEQFRKKLDQNLAQTQAQLNSFFGQPEGLLPPLTPMILPYEWAPQAISTIEERSEAEGEGSSANGHTPQQKKSKRLSFHFKSLSTASTFKSFFFSPSR